MVMHVKPIKVNKQQCGCVCDIDSSHTKKEHLINIACGQFLQRRQARDGKPHKQTGTWPRCLNSCHNKDGLSLIAFRYNRLVIDM